MGTGTLLPHSDLKDAGFLVDENERESASGSRIGAGGSNGAGGNSPFGSREGEPVSTLLVLSEGAGL